MFKPELLHGSPDPATPPAAAPQVGRTFGRVHLALDADEALALVQLLAHYDVLVSLPHDELVDQAFKIPDQPDAPALSPFAGYDATVWHETLVELLKARAMIHAPWPPQVAETVDVPVWVNPTMDDDGVDGPQ